MPTDTQPSSSLTDLTLQVRLDGGAEQEVFLQHGLSIGRNASNTICIDHPDVERIHAQIQRQPDGTMVLRCLEKHLHLAMADGSKVSELKLAPGTTFKLGKATIRCLKHQTKATVVVAETSWQVRCPRCHEIIATLERTAPVAPSATSPSNSTRGKKPTPTSPMRSSRPPTPSKAGCPGKSGRTASASSSPRVAWASCCAGCTTRTIFPRP